MTTKATQVDVEVIRDFYAKQSALRHSLGSHVMVVADNVAMAQRLDTPQATRECLERIARACEKLSASLDDVDVGFRLMRRALARLGE